MPNNCGRSLVSNQILRFRCRECRLNLISPLLLSGKLPHKQPKTRGNRRNPIPDQWEPLRASTILPRPFRKACINLFDPSNGGNIDQRVGSNKIDASRRIPNPYKTNAPRRIVNLVSNDTQSNDKSGTRYVIVLD